MHFDEHDYSEIALSCNLMSIRSLHIYYDLFFVKKVSLKMINCINTVNLFTKRNIHYNLRMVREFEKSNTQRNYIFDSTVPRLTRAWNIIAVPAGIANIRDLSQFKRELKALVFTYC